MDLKDQSYLPQVPECQELPDLSAWDLEAVKYLGGDEPAGRATFLCRDTSNDSPCVVKFVHFHQASWDSIRQVAEREVATLAELQHPRIPKLLRVLKTEEPWIGIVQEYLEGKPPSAFRLSEAELQQVASDILEVLIFIQKDGRAHLDIKSENVVIHTITRAAYLVDFGVARRIRASDSSGATSLVGGTPGFTDPDVLFRRKAPTNRSDLYGLGANLLPAYWA